MSQLDSTLHFSQSGDETKALIKYVSNKKWKYLVIILISGLFSFYYIKIQLFEYTSTASFFVNDQKVINNTSLENLPYGDNLNRIFQMVNSTKTQKHLIDKFNLYKHYKIDTTGEFHLQVAIEKIRSKIEVKKNPYNAIVVTVKDKDRLKSADMANEVVAFIDKLNQEYYIKNIQNTIQLSKAYLSQLEYEGKIKSIGIDSLIKDINHIVNSGHISNANLYYLLLQQQKLTQLVNVFETSATEILNAHKLYNLSLQTLNYNNFPTVSIIQTAMPDFSTGTLKAALLSCLIMIMVFLLLVLQAYFRLHYNGYLTLILTGK